MARPPADHTPRFDPSHLHPLHCCHAIATSLLHCCCTVASAIYCFNTPDCALEHEASRLAVLHWCDATSVKFFMLWKNFARGARQRRLQSTALSIARHYETEVCVHTHTHAHTHTHTHTRTHTNRNTHSHTIVTLLFHFYSAVVTLVLHCCYTHTKGRVFRQWARLTHFRRRATQVLILTHTYTHTYTHAHTHTHRHTHKNA
jgi:hypothetical protein